MSTGRLFRYCGHGGAEGSDASIAEKLVAEWIGTKYCIGVNSCSSAVRTRPTPHCARIQSLDAGLSSYGLLVLCADRFIDLSGPAGGWRQARRSSADKWIYIHGTSINDHSRRRNSYPGGGQP
eukprot:COSAG05_NODE_2105_length_3552_cov_3.767738_6_plen_123_part_00